MSEMRAKHIEGTSVDAPHLDAPKGDTSPTRWEEIPWVTTPIEVGGLADTSLGSLWETLKEEHQKAPFQMQTAR